MSKKTGKTEQIRVLKNVLNTFSMVEPLSNSIKCLIEKNFVQLSQSEAYEVLAYLVNMCVKDKKLKSHIPNVLTNLNSDLKMSIEKYKKDILQAIKDLSLNGKISITVLNKSDLLVPYCPKFFNCCLGLTNYGLSYQMSLHEQCCMGSGFLPNSADLDRYTEEEIESLKKTILEDTASPDSIRTMIEDGKKLTNEANKRCDLLNEEIEATKLDLKSHIKNSSISNCDYSKEDFISEAISRLSKEVDELHEKNSRKLDTLKLLGAFLQDLLNKDHKNIIVNGNDLLALIPYETHLFANEAGIDLTTNGNLNLQGLLGVVQKTMSDCIREMPGTSKLSIRPLEPLGTDQKYFILNKEKVVKRLQLKNAELKKKLGDKFDINEVYPWYNSFFHDIPSLKFDPSGSAIHFRDPVVDTEKLERLIRAKYSKKEKTAIKTAMQAPQSKSIAVSKKRCLRRRSKSASGQINLESSVTSQSTWSTIKSVSSSDFKQSRLLSKSSWNLSTKHSMFHSNSTLNIDYGFSSTPNVPVGTKDDKADSPLSSGNCNFSSTPKVPAGSQDVKKYPADSLQSHGSLTSQVSNGSFDAENVSSVPSASQECPSIDETNFSHSNSYDFSSPVLWKHYNSSRDINDTKGTFDESMIDLPDMSSSMSPPSSE